MQIFNPVTMANHATTLAKLVTLACDNSKANKAEADARDNRKGGLVDVLRDYVKETVAKETDTEAGAICLRIMLTNVTNDEGKAVIPGGTVKNYVSAFKGYRKILARGESIDEVSTAKANEEMASEEAKAIKAAKADFAKLSKDWTAAQWTAFVGGFAKPEATESDDSEVSDDEAKLVAAAA